MSSGFHFLVVDDMPSIRWTVASLLRQIGYTKVSEAGNGEQALRLLQSGDVRAIPINFIVTDWNMPVMNGIELLRAIRADAGLAHLPVLMVTSNSEADIIDAAKRVGVDGYLIKPLNKAAALKQALDEILKGRGVAA